MVLFVTILSISSLIGCKASLMSVYNYTCEHGPKINAVCGTFFGYSCPTSYHCVTDPMVADDQGICCPNKDDANFIEVTLSVFSGRPDPIFTVLNTNPNFTSILAAAKHHASSQLPSLLGYRGFQVRIVTYKGASQTVTIAKCTDPSFEKLLLFTISRLPDQHGNGLYRGLVEQLDKEIKSCTGKIDFIQITLSVYSGTRDPKFNLTYTNPNFTTIATTVSNRTSVPLTGILGYRGFEVKLHESGKNDTQTVTIGKCSYPGLENKLLQTVAKIPDTVGGMLLPTTVQYIVDEISGCMI